MVSDCRIRIPYFVYRAADGDCPKPSAIRVCFIHLKCFRPLPFSRLLDDSEEVGSIDDGHHRARLNISALEALMKTVRWKDLEEHS